MAIFKTEKHCGNCFWFIPGTGVCEFFKHEPDVVDSCCFFESKTVARKIIEEITKKMYHGTST